MSAKGNNNEQDRPCTYNVTLMPVCVTIVTVGPQ